MHTILLFLTSLGIFSAILPMETMNIPKIKPPSQQPKGRRGPIKPLIKASSDSTLVRPQAPIPAPIQGHEKKHPNIVNDMRMLVELIMSTSDLQTKEKLLILHEKLWYLSIKEEKLAATMINPELQKIYGNNAISIQELSKQSRQKNKTNNPFWNN